MLPVSAPDVARPAPPPGPSAHVALTVGAPGVAAHGWRGREAAGPCTEHPRPCGGGGLIRDGHGWRGSGETGQGPRTGWGPWEGEPPSPGMKALPGAWLRPGLRPGAQARVVNVLCPGCGTAGHRRSSEAGAGGLPGRGTLAGERSEDRHRGSNLSKAAPFLVGGHN